MHPRAIAVPVVWFVGFRDMVLTAALVSRFGAQAELNPVAALAFQYGGVLGAILLKLATLALVTVCVVRLEKLSRLAADRTAAVVVLISVALMMYWDWALWGL